MDKIQVKILNPESIQDSIKMMVCAARLTQRSEKVHNLKDFEKLLNKPYTDNLIEAFVNLPHPTIQKFGIINVIVVGASRRFLAQITRHQNEVKFMSGSLQYSDFSDNAKNDNFVVPYELIDTVAIKDIFLEQCKESMITYNWLKQANVNTDACGYVSPQSLRNVLIISATPYQWKHMISQRICRRNSLETRYVMLKIWEELYKLSPLLFSIETTGAFCQQCYCKEGKMSCKNSLKKLTPSEILDTDFEKIRRNYDNNT